MRGGVSKVISEVDKSLISLKLPFREGLFRFPFAVSFLSLLCFFFLFDMSIRPIEIGWF